MTNIKLYAVGTLTVALLINTTLTPSQVQAHGGATGIVKERMDAMTAMGDAMEIMGDMVKGKRQLNVEAFVEGAEIISKHSAEITELFPKGSGGGKSEALPNLWQEWDQFEAIAKRAQREADQLNRLAVSGNNNRDLKMQFIKLGKSCKSCHTDYRKKKK